MSSTTTPPPAPVTPAASTGPEAEEPELAALYQRFADGCLVPLWREIGDLMPLEPAPEAVAHVWHWQDLLPLAARAGDLVPVGRGGERRAIALANPGLGGRPYATPTLWAAIQYLGPGETAPEHRHAQNAFRFVIEGEGVWTVVNGDPVRMSRGDLLLTPGWNFHGHRNDSRHPMTWLDGLDIPLVKQLDTAFFEFGSERVTDEATPYTSRSERLWAHPGLRPLTGLAPLPHSPLSAYRWEHTDAALREQMRLEDEGFPATHGQGHAAVRFTNPTTGADVLPTIRAQFHRVRAGVATEHDRQVGSRVLQVFSGAGALVVDGRRHDVSIGDLLALPSWAPLGIEAETELDLFEFSDAPVIERLHFDRTQTMHAPR